MWLMGINVKGQNEISAYCAMSSGIILIVMCIAEIMEFLVGDTLND